MYGPDYLAEFMWSQQFGKNNHQHYNFWMQIADECTLSTTDPVP